MSKIHIEKWVDELHPEKWTLGKMQNTKNPEKRTAKMRKKCRHPDEWTLQKSAGCGILYSTEWKKG